MQGLIIKIISGDYFVKVNEEIIKCKPLGVFRHKKVTPKVGDIVEVEENTITKIQERKNELIRPVVANIDKVFIVTSLVEPDLNLNLLDRIICQAEYNNIEIVLVFTKVDLTDANKYNNIFEYYKSLGYRIYLAPNDFELIKKEIDNNVCVVAGQSGVGKSTLINLFDNFNIKTDEISKALGRGKHTTRHVELYSVFDGLVVDTPGFSALDLSDLTNIDIRDNMKEMFDNLDYCKYRDCMHIKEDNCYIKYLVDKNEIMKSRYDNYLSFLKK